jgi:hypothetical protein
VTEVSERVPWGVVREKCSQCDEEVFSAGGRRFQVTPRHVLLPNAAGIFECHSMHVEHVCGEGAIEAFVDELLDRAPELGGRKKGEDSDG